MVDGPTTGEKTQIPMQDKFTILEAFQNKVGKENILYTPGADLEKKIKPPLKKSRTC
jgi:beta-glucosidase